MTKKNHQRLYFFMKIARIFVSLAALLLISVFLMYFYVDTATYDVILFIFIVLLGIIIVIAAILVYILTMAYKKRKMPKILAVVIGKCIKLVMSIAIQIAAVFKMDKDIIRGFFVDFNNIMVEAKYAQYTKEQILILVPHCLQWSECKHKVTNDPNNCKRCGKCTIQDIIALSKDYGVNLCIASGGTMARKAIKEHKPHLIVSVACSRDLIAGILDVENIPVIAIENTTPKGPCVDTQVCVERIAQILEKAINN